MGGLRNLARELRRAAGWHRRLLAAGLLAGAVAFAIDAVAPAPPATAAVVVAGRDLPAGLALHAGDLAVYRLPAAAVPAGVRDRPPDLIGRVLAGPVRRGEPLTDARLIGRGLLAALPAGHVAAPVRLADAATTGLLRPGDLVDLVAARPADPGRRPGGSLVARAARVLTVPAVADSTGDGGLVVLDVDPATAMELAVAAVSARLSVVLRPG